jgi:hypothetical protein
MRQSEYFRYGRPVKLHLVIACWLDQTYENRQTASLNFSNGSCDRLLIGSDPLKPNPLCLVTDDLVQPLLQSEA